jgi:hypothetical protein
MACSAPDVVVVHEPSVERSDRADKRLRAPPVVLRALSRAATTTTGSSSSSGGGGGDLHVVSASCCLLTCEQTEYSLSSLSSVRCVSRCACPVCPEPVLVKCSFLASIDIRAVTKPTRARCRRPLLRQRLASHLHWRARGQATPSAAALSAALSAQPVRQRISLFELSLPAFVPSPSW